MKHFDDLKKSIQNHLLEIERDLQRKRDMQATEIKAQLLQAKSTGLLALVTLYAREDGDAT